MSSISNFLVFEKVFSKLSIENFRCPYSDTYQKKLLSGPAILLFLEAHLRQLESLDEMEDNLKANDELQRFLNLNSIHGSSLCRKLGNLPTYLLQNLTTSISSQLASNAASSDIKSKVGSLSIVDSSEVTLPRKAGEWAYSSKDKTGIKIHMLYQWIHEDVQFAKEFVSSTAAVSDQEATIYLVYDKNTTYVFDRGYINYSLYRDWIQNEIQFVVRIKSNSKTAILEEYSVNEKSSVIRDAKVELEVPTTKEKIVLRLVEYIDEQGKIYRVLTSRWDLSAEEIEEIYRKRWAIEIFFKWIKQHLQTIHWYSYHESAVWNQIYLAYIAYGLTELIKQELSEIKKTRWELLKKVKAFWFKTWNTLIEVLTKKPERTSKGRRKKGKPGRPRKHPKKMKSVKKMDPNLKK